MQYDPFLRPNSQCFLLYRRAAAGANHPLGPPACGGGGGGSHHTRHDHFRNLWAQSCRRDTYGAGLSHPYRRSHAAAAFSAVPEDRGAPPRGHGHQLCLCADAHRHRRAVWALHDIGCGDYRRMCGNRVRDFCQTDPDLFPASGYRDGHFYHRPLPLSHCRALYGGRER